MSLVIISGMSGAGKSKVVQSLEDMAFFCVDNVPPQLMPKFAELLQMSDCPVQKMALVVDARGGRLFSDFIKSFDELKQLHNDVRLLFIEADDEVLLRRYKEQRRRHPLASRCKNNLSEAIAEEHKLLSAIRQRADFIVDTSQTKVSQLRQRIQEMFSQDLECRLFLRFISFGFKNGLPKEADLVYDLRCLPNPFYIKPLKNKTGCDQEVFDYIFNSEVSEQFYTKIRDFIDFGLKYYQQEGKQELVVAFGCTGGKHRSVAMAERFYRDYSASAHPCTLFHRDIEKDQFL
ncbi:MAG: RNase adapter RapZ [Eubacteriales bacterium]|nr:RNase adapter RapZ [Eubacteriales bacterium]